MNTHDELRGLLERLRGAVNLNVTSDRQWTELMAAALDIIPAVDTALDQLAALETQMKAVREALGSTADALENLLSADPDMPTYKADYDQAEIHLNTARAALADIGEGK